jgi:hypothetical protein
MSGFTDSFPHHLPDGSLPDVSMYNPASGAVFIGEAKHTEDPENKETGARLARYLAWYLRLGRLSPQKGVFALCFGDPQAKNRWRSALIRYAGDVGFKGFDVEIIALGSDLWVCWLK